MPGPVDETRRGDASEARHAVHAGKIDSLRAALQSLPPNEREVFLLRQNGGLAYEEIARQRQCSLETIKPATAAPSFERLTQDCLKKIRLILPAMRGSDRPVRFRDCSATSRSTSRVHSRRWLP
jgi:Sigma-70, region 4